MLKGESNRSIKSWKSPGCRKREKDEKSGCIPHETCHYRGTRIIFETTIGGMTQKDWVMKTAVGGLIREKLRGKSKEGNEGGKKAHTASG